VTGRASAAADDAAQRGSPRPSRDDVTCQVPGQPGGGQDLLHADGGGAVDVRAEAADFRKPMLGQMRIAACCLSPVSRPTTRTVSRGRTPRAVYCYLGGLSVLAAVLAALSSPAGRN
jgi:hypothetical protein